MDNDLKGVTLKILILEDSAEDKELIGMQLLRAGLIPDITHAVTEHEFLHALQTASFDLILSDFKLTGFDAFEALKISMALCPDVPFICISGTIGEETAIELLKRGAVDYVLKDRPERLPFAVKRALDEAGEKVARLKALKDLQESEYRFKQIAENTLEWIWEVDSEGLYVYANPVISSFLGYTAEEIVGKKHFYDFFVPEKKNMLKSQAFEVFGKRESFRNFENANIHKNGQTVILSTSGNPIIDKNGILLGYRGVDADITEQKKAETALKESEEKFRNLFQEHAAIKLILDPQNGFIVDANQAAANFYGWSVEELKRMKLDQINTLPPEVLLLEMEKVKNLKKIHFEFKHKKADNTIVDVEVFSSSIKIGGKQFLHSIIHDISERKKAEESIKLLIRAVESSSVSIVVTDFNGKIMYTNPFFTALTGYTAVEVDGKSPQILNSGYQSKEFYRDLWNTILSGRDWEGEFRNKKKNGEMYWEKAVISPIVNSEGKLTHFVAIKEDITERKRILTELVNARDKAEESNRLKTAFLQNMSHEIRTPMNGILGFVDLLRQPNLSGEERNNFIDIVNKSGHRLLTTINAIIEISKIESGAVDLHYSREKVTELLRTHYNFFLPETQLKGLDFTFSNSNDIPDVIELDKFKFDSIIVNLLSNAIKFTQRGSISIGYYPIKDYMVFYVKDTGMGIPEEMHDKVFERFVQADSTITRAYEGSGLGLAICKAYVEMMGGKIWLESAAGAGSTFTFTIPFSRNIQHVFTEQSGKPAETIVAFPNMKILVAEDDEVSFLFLKTLFEEFDIEPIRAVNGQQAIDKLKTTTDISLIFMDLRMPVVNGLEATRSIRQFNQEIPIIAVTAYAFPSDMENAFEAGCTDFISKPVYKDSIIRLIQKHVQKQES